MRLMERLGNGDRPPRPAVLNAGLLAQMKSGRAVPFATRYARLALLIERVFDLPAILRASVGLRRARLAQRDQTQLLDAFRSYTVSSYVANFDHDGGQRFVALPAKRSVDEQVVVATQIVPPSGTPARIDYALRREKSESGVLWKAIDVVLEGSISRVAVQRSEFYDPLRNGGVANLIASLRHKTADFSGDALSRPAGKVSSGSPR
jgi:phospholipid transport system substrate-binding protein